MAARLALFGAAACVLALSFIPRPASSAPGINHTINFQGKIVNPDGTNVANGSYDITFKIYTVASAGTPVWTETRTAANQVTLTNGIFQVALGSVTALPGSVDFNTDNIYLGITFNNDASGEMSPRIQFSAVPQAFNAEKVGGIASSSLARNDTANTFTGGDQLINRTSATAFSIQNASNAGNLFIADTANTKIGIGAAPVSTGAILQVTGTVSVSTLGSAGTSLLCVDGSSLLSACNTGNGGGAGSGSFILNGTSLQANANFNIQSAAAASVGGVIRGAVSQTANLQEWQNSAGTVLARINSGGGLVATSGWFSQTLNSVSQLVAKPVNVSTVPVLVQGAASQTADLLQVQNSAGTVLSRFDAGGALILPATGSNFISLGGSGANIPYGGLEITGGKIYLQTAAASTVGQIIKGAASQTANLQEWQNSAGTVLASVDASGNLILNAPTGSTGQLRLQNNGTDYLTADATNKRLTVTGGELWVYNNLNNPRLLLGDSGASGQYGYLQWDSTNDYFRIETDGTNGLKVKGNNVAIGNIFPSNPLDVGVGATNVLSVAATTGAATFKNATNSTTAFQVQNAAGTPLLNVDTTTYNLISNGSFEPNTTGWTAKGSATISRSTAEHYTGPGAGSVTTTATANDGISYQVSLSPSTQYTLSFMAKAGSTFNTMSIGRQEVSGTDIDCATGQSLSLTGWTRFSCSFTTGATITAPTSIYIKQSSTTARTFYIDAVQLEQAASLTPYHQGALAVSGVVTDPLTLQNSSNSSFAFQIADASGTQVLKADTLNQSVSIGSVGAATNAKLLVTGTSGTGAALIVNASGSANSLKLQNSGTDVLTVTASGATTIKNSTDSTAAFQIQNAAGTSNLFVADTTNTRIGIGTAAPASLLQLGSDAGTAASGITFGSTGDTNLYRNGVGKLQTDGKLYFNAATATNPTVGTYVTGDSFNRYSLQGGGTQEFGTGAAARDTQISRGPSGGITIKPISGQADQATAFQVQNAAGTQVLTVDTSAPKVAVGTGALLNAGQSASAPASPVNGSMYYDTTLQKLRIYQDGAWQNVTGGNAGQTPSVSTYNNADISVANAAITWLTFNSERWDTDSMHDLVTNNGRIVANTTGKYLIHAQVRFAANGTGTRELLLRQNGTTTIADVYPNSAIASSTTYTELEINKVVSLSAGDYIEVGVWQNSGAALNVSYAADHSPEVSASKLDGGGGTGGTGSSVPAARVYNSAAESIASATDVALTFDSERTDTDNIHSTATNTSRLTANTAGFYTINSSIEWSASTVARGLGLKLRLNGTAEIAKDYFYDTGLNVNISRTVSTTYYLNAGDYVETTVFQNSGAANTVNAVANYSPEFSMVKLDGGLGGTLQGSYDSGNLITTTDARDVKVTLADTTTDANFILNVAAGSTGQLQVQNAGVNTFTVGGTTGAALFKNNVNSTSALQVQNAAGTTTVLNADTTNARVGVGTPTPQAALHVAGGIISSSFPVNGLFTDTAAVAQGVGGGIAFSGDCGLGGNLLAGGDCRFAGIRGTKENATSGDKSGSLLFFTRAGGSTALSQVASLSSGGAALFQNSANSTTAFRVQDAGGTKLLTVDSTNQTVGIGSAGAATDAKLYASSSLNVIRANSTSTASNILELQKSGTKAFTVAGTGNVVSSDGSNAGLSVAYPGSATAYVINNGVSAANNEAQNPGFELSSLSLTDGSSGWSGAGSITVDALNAHGGNNYLNITANSTTQGSAQQKVFAVTPGETIYAEVWVKTASGTNGSGGFYWGFDDKDHANTVYVNGDWTNPGTAWTRKLLTATVPAGKYYARFQLTVRNDSTTGSWQFDDALIYHNQQAAPTVFKNNVDSTTAFQVQNAAGTSNLFVADTTNTRIGIGTATPSAPLDVQDAASNNGIRVTSGTGSAALNLYTTDSTAGNRNWRIANRFNTLGSLDFMYSSLLGGTPDTLAMTINNSGTVGIGVTSPNSGYKLDVNGNIQSSGFQVANGATYSNDRIYYVPGAAYYVLRSGDSVGVRLDNGATSWAAQSDIRSKDILEGSIADGLQKVGKIRNVIYKFKTDPVGTRRVGVIAQDIQAVLPEAVDVDAHTGMLGVRYTELVPLAFSAIQELDTRTRPLAGLDVSRIAMQGSDAQFNNLNVSGRATVSDLTVVGTATIGTLTVTGSAQFAGDITVGGHIITAGGQPAVQVQAGAGSGASVSVDGNDTSGTITITTGREPLSIGDLVKLVFSKPYGKPPRILITAQDGKSARTGVFPAAKTATDFMLRMDAMPLPNTIYTFDYLITQ